MAKTKDYENYENYSKEQRNAIRLGKLEIWLFHILILHASCYAYKIHAISLSSQLISTAFYIMHAASSRFLHPTVCIRRRKWRTHPNACSSLCPSERILYTYIALPVAFVPTSISEECSRLAAVLGRPDDRWHVQLEEFPWPITKPKVLPRRRMSI